MKNVGFYNNKNQYLVSSWLYELKKFLKISDTLLPPPSYKYASHLPHLSPPLPSPDVPNLLPPPLPLNLATTQTVD